MEEVRTLLNLLYKVGIILIKKPDKDIIRKENYRPLLPMNIDKHPQQIVSKLNPALY